MNQFPCKTKTQEFSSGWDLIAPKGWGMAIWKSLVFASARTGGLRERHLFSFESGLPHFPQDYPCNPTFENLMEKLKQERQVG